MRKRPSPSSIPGTNRHRTQAMKPIPLNPDTENVARRVMAPAQIVKGLGGLHANKRGCAPGRFTSRPQSRKFAAHCRFYFEGMLID
jgi:hypothetical protein